MNTIKIERAGQYIEQPRTVADVLEIIEDFAERYRHGERPTDLWAVLTALRGPDDSAAPSPTKAKTTSRIRAAALPNLASAAYADVRSGTVDVSEIPPGHFRRHVTHAVRVLQRMGREI